MTSTLFPADALRALRLAPIEALGGARAAFLGCGDSLAAARPAERLGHRVLSAGDVAWSGRPPAGVDVVVALSWSGRTGATIKAAETARNSGLRLVAITSDPDSPLAGLAERHVTLPNPGVSEEIPALGYLLHATAVAGLCGLPTASFPQLAAGWTGDDVPVAAERPEAITVASSVGARGAAEFWSLKLIEATGVAVRTPELEEIGHVDYFVGPQAHLTYVLTDAPGRARATQLGAALERNGHAVHVIGIDHPGLPEHSQELLAAVRGAELAARAARAWGRAPFRGGEVDMSAAHIQVRSETENET